MNKISIFNTHIHNLTMQETLDIVDETISSVKQIHHVVVNACKFVVMQKDLQRRQSVNERAI